jgi:nucleoid-associated protein YgaU
MFEPDSRYHDLGTARLIQSDGRVVVYKQRRFIPPASRLQSQSEAVVSEGDRLDLIAARELGDPEHYWRLCDANGAMNPPELIEPGRALRIPLPGL